MIPSASIDIIQILMNKSQIVINKMFPKTFPKDNFTGGKLRAKFAIKLITCTCSQHYVIKSD